MNKGQIQLGALITITSLFIAGITGTYFKNDTKAQQALDGVAEIRGDMKVINVKLDFLIEERGAKYDAITQKVVEYIATTTRVRK